ncbi:MAG: GYD domain-containing protein, partial [Dehalococcoidia bacterium]
MPTYVALMKLTEQGLKDIKNFPQRLEAAKKGMGAVGGKMVAFYTVLGEYDYVAVTEFPNDEVGMGFLLTLGALGNVRTTTLKAFTESEFTDIV